MDSIKAWEAHLTKIVHAGLSCVNGKPDRQGNTREKVRWLVEALQRMTP